MTVSFFWSVKAQGSTFTDFGSELGEPQLRRRRHPRREPPAEQQLMEGGREGGGGGGGGGGGCKEGTIGYRSICLF